MSGRRANPILSRVARLRKLGPLAPRLRIGLRLGPGGDGSTLYRFPFKRSPVAIVVMGAFVGAFCIPYFTMGGFLDRSGDDSLFGMVGTLFSLFWLLGWSVGVATLLAVFLIVAFGEETLQLRPGWLTVRIEVLRLGVGADFQAAGTADPRWEPGSAKAGGEGSGSAWRGDHLAFVYGGETIRVGSAVGEARCGQIVEQIQSLSIDRAPRSSRPGADTRGIDPGALVDTPEPEHTAARPTVETGWQAASTRALILANLIPLIGVLVYDWNIGEIMLLFWAESAIIGLFNLLKMWVIGRWSVLFIGPLFIGHYGGFMIIHLLFVYTLFLSGAGNAGPTVDQVLADFVRLWPALLGLVASHAISFRLNFLGGGEYRGVTIRRQMGAPYRRIVVMHLTIILGGFLAMAFRTPLLALALLIILKIIVDVKSHVGERGQSRRQAK